MSLNVEKFIGEDLHLEAEFKKCCEDLKKNGRVGDNTELLAISLMCKQSVQVYTLVNCKKFGLDRPERVFDDGINSQIKMRLLQASGN